MFSKWTQHLRSDTDKEEFRQAIKGSKPILDRIIQILDERETAIDTYTCDVKTFDSPSWPYLQAALVGKKSELREIKKLLTLDQKET